MYVVKSYLQIFFLAFWKKGQQYRGLCESKKNLNQDFKALEINIDGKDFVNISKGPI